MVHKPKHKVHSFRGLLADGGEDEIRLERQNANVAYRIVKLQIIGAEPGEGAMEHTVKIYKDEQSSIDNAVNFTDPSLLAVAYIQDNTSSGDPSSVDIIFDNVLFSRNIFVTQVDTGGSLPCNYYIEIEEVPVSASALMQLKLGVARRLNLEQ